MRNRRSNPAQKPTRLHKKLRLNGGYCAKQNLPAELTILHVVDVSKGFSFDMPAGADVALFEQLRQDGDKLLLRARATLPDDLPVQSLIREGSPKDVIVEVARDNDVDLIVIGTHSHSRVMRFVLGSTAEAVVRQAPCMVLTIGQEPRALRAERLEEIAESTV